MNGVAVAPLGRDVAASRPSIDPYAADVRPLVRTTGEEARRMLGGPGREGSGLEDTLAGSILDPDRDGAGASETTSLRLYVELI